MKYIKLFETFKNNNIEGSLITKQDIIDCIRNGGVVYATIIKNLPNNKPDNPLKVVSIDDDGLVTVEFNGSEYDISLKNIEKIDY